MIRIKSSVGKNFVGVVVVDIVVVCAGDGRDEWPNNGNMMLQVVHYMKLARINRTMAHIGIV